MTNSQIADINNRLDTLTQRVNNIELLTETIGTSQATITMAGVGCEVRWRRLGNNSQSLMK
jgi:hypothetical protein